MKYFNCHSHTMYSNIRLLDCINRPKALIDKAIELGLGGIAITDHECLAAHIEVNQYAKEIKEKYPEFKIALGNEIYLTDDRSMGQKYYHFILIAKDAVGHKALRELSSAAWYNSYSDRGMERVPLLKTELQNIMSRYKGHVIATTACMGGELSTLALEKHNLEIIGQASQHISQKMLEFTNFCKEIFGDDFYIECAPSKFEDQIAVNKMLKRFADAVGIKMVVGTDAHYLTAVDRPIHKAYLNSKDGDREVDDFYEFSHLMTSDEIYELLGLCFNKEDITSILNNTVEIQNKISFYSLERKQAIPKVEVYDYSKVQNNNFIDYPIITKLLSSDNIQERFWINKCLAALKEKNLWNNEYIARIETEADVIDYIGSKLDDCLFAYFNTFNHYINLFWECGSIVGPGRGSATGFLSNYLLGITQLDPIRWNLPYWRFLNKERAELPDIDIDLAPSKRPAIFDAIRKERGEFGLVQVATFGTEGTKSAIQTACRGYRSEEYPDGIDVDQSLYMSSLIPQERGFLWSISDVIYGNEEKDRKPVSMFINEVNRFPGLLDIIQYIEGMVCRRGIHASGVILYGEDPFETASFMKAPNGSLTTCYDLHNAEAAGDTKYDFLVTEASDKIIQCYELLLKDKQIPQIPLRQFYDEYLHPEVIDVNNQEIWDHLGQGDILDVFQFATGVGLNIAKKLKPQNMLEMTAASALMRLMSEKGKESPQDRFLRIKLNPTQFEIEMNRQGLTFAQKEAFHKYCDSYYGTVPLQEQMMEILMDKDIANFTLAEANAARKIVAKKQMNKIPQLKQQLYDKVPQQNYADYIWEIAVAPSLGYAFSLNHSLPYSFVGVQMIYLATNWSPIYWNTSCLIVNSGSLEDNSEEELVDIYEPEAADLAEGVTFTDLPDRSGKIRKTVSTDYGKLAKAIGDIQSAGIKISLIDINKSDFGFKPDVENNQILFGLKGLLNVNDELVKNIILNRPYASPQEFLEKINPKKQAMVSLIKSGAFDSMMERVECMKWYIWEVCDKKKRITLQNMAALIKYNLIPNSLLLNKKIFEFNRYLKAVCKKDSSTYKLDNRATQFLLDIEHDDLIYGEMNLDIKDWEKVYQRYMDSFRDWINDNKDNLLTSLNNEIFKEEWEKYAKGNISSWEMEVLCFYYHEHELAKVNKFNYGFTDFSHIPETPVVEKTYKARGGYEIKMFKLYKICGTCIAKNKTKSTVTLLTTDGVVNVKFRKEYFSLFDKQISERQPDGTKKVVEKSWFNRGNMIVVQGIRSGDDFITKKYSSTAGHQLYRISDIFDDGSINLTNYRYQGGVQEDA